MKELFVGVLAGVVWVLILGAIFLIPTSQKRAILMNCLELEAQYNVKLDCLKRHKEDQ